LKGEVYKAVLENHLDPYLGYLHSIQFSKPSMVCDLQEPFRAVIEEFLLEYHTRLDKSCFIKHGNRVFLKQNEKFDMINKVLKKLEEKIPYNRRNYSKTTKIKIVIREETIKVAQYIRGEPLNTESFIYL
jgi:CRISPR-associated endonuclease Cas1